MKKIGVLGSGVVGATLANGLLELGHPVMRGSRDASKLAAWKEGRGPNASVGSFSEAARFAELAVLAVKGTAAEAVLELCGPGLEGKTVLDTNNPIADLPPVNGVLQFFTGPNDSLMERLQNKAPGVRFVKAFSCIGAHFMVRPDFGGQKPTMFTCGNDAAAKEEARTLLSSLGWETEDMGAVESARAIEPLCMLWCIPGLRGGSWAHAFKLLKK